MKLGIVYKAQSPEGKFYIGATTQSLRLRKRGHKYCALNEKSPIYNSKFSKAIRKYGYNNFVWITLHSNVPENILKHLERDEIEVHNSYNNGYNSTIDGRSALGLYHTEEWNQSHSERMRGSGNSFYQKTHSEETKRKILLKKYNNNRFKISDETRKRMSISRMGDKNPMYGKKRPKELINKLRLSKTKIYVIENSITGEKYEVFGIPGINKFTKHHWGISGRTFYNKKRWHCFNLNKK